jgi:hypothetical protein
MALKKGLIILDFYYFKNINFTKKKRCTKKKLGVSIKNIKRTNFLKRRSDIIYFLSHYIISNSSLQYYSKPKIYESKIYEKGGLFIFFTEYFVCFKILKKKIPYSFLLKKIKVFLDEKIKSKYLLYIVERYDFLSEHTQMKLDSLMKKYQKNIKWVFIRKISGKNKEMVKYIKKRVLIETLLFFGKSYQKNHFKPNWIQWFHVKKNNFSFRKKKIHHPFNLSRLNGKPDFKFLLEKIKIITKFNSPFNLFWVKFFLTHSNINTECLNVFVPNSVRVDYNRFFNYKKIFSKFSSFLRVILKKNQKKQYLILIFFLFVYFYT